MRGREPTHGALARFTLGGMHGVTGRLLAAVVVCMGVLVTGAHAQVPAPGASYAYGFGHLATAGWRYWDGDSSYTDLLALGVVQPGRAADLGVIDAYHHECTDGHITITNFVTTGATLENVTPLMSMRVVAAAADGWSITFPDCDWENLTLGRGQLTRFVDVPLTAIVDFAGSGVPEHYSGGGFGGGTGGVCVAPREGLVREATATQKVTGLPGIDLSRVTPWYANLEAGAGLQIDAGFYQECPDDWGPHRLEVRGLTPRRFGG